MAKFNIHQENQIVGNQVIADTIGTINLGTVKNSTDFKGVLQNLLSELSKLQTSDKTEKSVIADAKSSIEKAIIEAEEPTPNQELIVKHIEGAKTLLEGVTSAVGLVSTLIQASKMVGEFFR